MSLEEVVSSYLKEHAAAAARELRYYQIQRALEDAIREAALSRLPNRKGRLQRHPHQRRIPLVALVACEERLQAVAAALRHAGSFDELHSVVASNIADVPGIGDLTVYDVAQRIGAWRRIEPALVYLHAGTRSGAALLGVRGRAVSKDQFPASLRALTAAQLEDCLCIYRDEIAELLA